MRKHWSLFYVSILILTVVVSLLAQIVTTIGFNLTLGHFLTNHSETLKLIMNAVIDLVGFGIWWVLNHSIFQAKINWRGFAGKSRQWLLLLPVLIVVFGDATLGAQYVLTPTNIVIAIILGLSVGILEEYIFRGILVNQLYAHFHFGALATAGLSGLAFGVIHGINGLTTGNWTNTSFQMLMALGLGFFLAAIYLVTNNLWLPIVFHAIIDAFDQIAFGSLSNNVGISPVTSTIYCVVFLILGVVIVNRGTVAMEREHGSQQPTNSVHEVQFMKNDTASSEVSLWKTVVTIILFAGELILASVLVHPGQSKATSAIIVVTIAVVVFLGMLWMYHDLLSVHWQTYKQHLLRNLVIDFGLTIGIYVLLAIVRKGLDAFFGANQAMALSHDFLSAQSVASASIALLSSLTVLMAPFTEELAFRHVFFMQWQKNRLLLFLMFFVSSIAFGLIHWNNFNGDVLKMVPYMFIGAYFAVIYYFSKNIWQNIMTHFMFDFVQFAAAVFLFIFAFFQ
ncbi:lysostaphin resistance A-like protein [Paucilactobacillus sp. N302-9]